MAADLLARISVGEGSRRAFRTASQNLSADAITSNFECGSNVGRGVVTTSIPAARYSYTFTGSTARVISVSRNGRMQTDKCARYAGRSR